MFRLFAHPLACCCVRFHVALVYNHPLSLCKAFLLPSLLLYSSCFPSFFFFSGSSWQILLLKNHFFSGKQITERLQRLQMLAFSTKIQYYYLLYITLSITNMSLSTVNMTTSSKGWGLLWPRPLLGFVLFHFFFSFLLFCVFVFQIWALILANQWFGQSLTLDHVTFFLLPL